MVAKKKSHRSSKTSPFEFVNAINKKNNYELIESHEDDYEPFIINRAFSYFTDSLFIANEVNRLSGSLSKRAQFDFYYHLLSKRSRFSKWIKKEDLEDGSIFKSKKHREFFEALCIMYSREYGMSRRRVLQEVFPLMIDCINNGVIDKSIMDSIIRDEMLKGGQKSS